MNYYFATERNQNIKTVVIEKLRFTSPSLSKRLNRIIQNFGLALFKTKLNELSQHYSFTVHGVNPAYTSQECVKCGYIDARNRNSQSIFKCLCCKTVVNADINASRMILKRFQEKSQTIVGGMGRSKILENIKESWFTRLSNLAFQGKISRRDLLKTLLENKYFKKGDVLNFVTTMKASGVVPIDFRARVHPGLTTI